MFSIKNFSSKCDQIRTADLVTFTREILNGKRHFLCSEKNPEPGQKGSAYKKREHEIKKKFLSGPYNKHHPTHSFTFTLLSNNGITLESGHHA